MLVPVLDQGLIEMNVFIITLLHFKHAAAGAAQQQSRRLSNPTRAVLLFDAALMCCLLSAVFPWPVPRLSRWWGSTPLRAYQVSWALWKVRQPPPCLERRATMRTYLTHNLPCPCPCPCACAHVRVCVGQPPSRASAPSRALGRAEPQSRTAPSHRAERVEPSRHAQ